MRFGRFTSVILGVAACSLLNILPTTVAQSTAKKPPTAASMPANPAAGLIDINSAIG